MTRVSARLSLLFVATLVVQTTIVAGMAPGQPRPDVMLLLTVAAGVVGGPERGALVGFAAGLASDLFLSTPFGLSALVLGLVGFLLGTLQANLLRAAAWMVPLTAALASAGGILLFAVSGAVVGQDHFVTSGLAVIVVAVALANGALSLVWVRLTRWALAGSIPDDDAGW